MTISEIDLLKNQLHECLFLNAGVKNLSNLTPTLEIIVNPDKTVKSAKVSNNKYLFNEKGEKFIDKKTNTWALDPSFRTAAESAMRALNNPECKYLKLPDDKYDEWREITFTFDFSWMYE